MCQISININDYKDKYTFLRTLILNRPKEFTVQDIYILANQVQANAVTKDDVFKAIHDLADGRLIKWLDGKYFPYHMFSYTASSI